MPSKSINLDYTKEQLIDTLKKHQSTIGSVFEFDLNAINTIVPDWSSNNKELSKIDFADVKSYEKYSQNFLKENDVVAGVGGYLEERIIYTKKDLFEVEDDDNAEPRNIHLGIDVSVGAGTTLLSPLDATVHSFADNAIFGDYGPTIILEHQLDNLIFYTLYGHLSRQSLVGKTNGQKIAKGDVFATLGKLEENGQWPPHLHFQMMLTMLDYKGDFPGVCAKSKLDYYKEICPNPNWILKIDKLPY